MLLLGRLPKEGDAVEWLGWRFEIVDMDGRRVDKVFASRLRAAHGMAEVVPKGEEPSPQIERGAVDKPHDARILRRLSLWISLLATNRPLRHTCEQL